MGGGGAARERALVRRLASEVKGAFLRRIESETTNLDGLREDVDAYECAFDDHSLFQAYAKKNCCWQRTCGTTFSWSGWE